MPNADAEPYTHGLGGRSEAILNQLRDSIRNGHYRLGERLPTERALCDKLGVSRNTIRRALERLRTDGLLEAKQGAGTFVCENGKRQSDMVAVMSMFGMEALSRLQNRLLDQDCLLCLYCQAHNAWTPESERAFLTKVLDHGYRALLANCSPLPPFNTDLLKELSARGTRVIHTGWQTASLPEEEYLLPDYHLAGTKAAKLLHQRGYQTLVTIGPDISYPISTLLEDGFNTTLAELKPRHQGKVKRIAFQPGWEAKLKRLCKRADGGIGFFCQTREYGEAVAARLLDLDLTLGTEAGLLAVPMSNEGPADVSDVVDTLDYDIDTLLGTAADRAVSIDAEPVHELIPPILTARGSLC
ncbi:MAG: GntR family transcriptional regulator [Planctomycetota bacterium]|jgi:DNA-binding transcriptional regulator YhcF (GntR family)